MHDQEHMPARDRVWLTILFLLEVALPAGIAFWVSPLLGAIVLGFWGVSYLVLVPKYFSQSCSRKRLLFHLVWCAALTGLWALTMLSSHLTTLYVPSRHPSLDSDLLKSTTEVSGIIFACLCLLRLIWLVAFHGSLIKSQPHDSA